MITVIGYDGGSLPAQALAAVSAATLVVGGERHLAAAHVPTGTPTRVLGDVAAGMDALAGHDGNAVVLASGDPGFFGITRRLRAARLPVTAVPAVSSVALAFARVGLEWDDALVVSAHGRDPRPALNVCRRFTKVAVLTDTAFGPAQLGAALTGLDRVLVVAERLGEPDERVVELAPEDAAARDEWQEPNVVLVLDDAWRLLPPAPRPWLAGVAPEGGCGLPDEGYLHRAGMVTKAEVRAQAVARLAPRIGDLVWDVGAGSGSVGIECARFGADVHAVEQDSEDAQRVRDNAATHAVHVHVVHGRAPEALTDLPQPDAVLVGGGGPQVVAACAARGPARLVVLLATLELVPPSLATLTGYDVDTVLLQASRLTPLNGGSRLVPSNPVFILSAVRR